MKFPRHFKRYVGDVPKGEKELGSDKPPTSPPRTSDDNQLAMRLANINGFNVQRIAVGCGAPSKAPPLPATLFVHEDSTGRWFKGSTEARELVPGAFVYFDMPVPADNANVGMREVGALEVCLVVEKPSGAPPGEYVFIMSGDVSCPV